MASQNTNNAYKSAVWLYLILLIFEGGIRRWLLPSFSTPLLVIRDPIVVWLVIEGIRNNWIKGTHAILMMIIASISFFITVFFGHQNFLAALYGWRIYFFYFPLIFVIPNILTRNDILKMGRFVLYLSIPMTLLIIMQFYSPQSALVNRGVGGDIDGAGFGGAMGYFRPPGTFSFTNGYVCFQLIVACFLTFYLLTNRSLNVRNKINDWLLWLVLLCYLVSIPYSISRTHFFQSLVMFLFAGTAAVLGRQNKKYIFWAMGLLATSVFLLSYFNILSDSTEVFIARFESASDSEGGLEGTLGNRYLGAIGRALNGDFPFFGYGLGFGTNVGAKSLGLENMYTKFNSDQEWVRVFGECGFILGLSIMLIRVHFSLAFFVNSYRQLIENNNFLSWHMAPAILIVLMMGPLNSNTSLGFAVFIGGIGLASLKIKKKTRKSLHVSKKRSF